MKRITLLLLLAAATLASFLASTRSAVAQDYEREQRWADQILPALMVGDAVWLEQANGHKFLTLYTVAEKPRGALIIAHGRGWSPDYELYGSLRTKLAEQGYTTLAIQLPVLGGGAPGSHKIEGIGIGFAPPLWRRDEVDGIVGVSTDDANAMARRLAREEAIFAGTSTGANVVAAIELAKRLGVGKTVGTIAVDSGLRYLSTDAYRA